MAQAMCPCSPGFVVRSRTYQPRWNRRKWHAPRSRYNRGYETIQYPIFRVAG